MMASIEHRSVPPGGDSAWLLLAELNHRIGNELQAALSALRLAKRGLGSGGEPVRFLEEAVVRLEGFADIHHILDRQRGQGPLAKRLEALCRAISLSKAAPLGIHMNLALDDVVVDEEAAWTICVVASELMTNAVKHAFSGRAAGVVAVVLEQDPEGVSLTVADNGVGAAYRSAETVWQSPGFGSGIVAQLAERLDGMVTRVGGPSGTSVTLRVPTMDRAR